MMGAVIKVIRRARRDVQQRRVFELTLDLTVHVRERIFEVVRNVFVELVVLLVLDVALVARPQRGGLVHRLQAGLVLALLCHHDGQRDVIRVARDYGPHTVRLQQLILVFAKVQHHLGAASRPVQALDGVLTVAARLPTHAALGRKTRAARRHRDLVRNDEARIETDPELTDELGVARLIAGQALEELARAGLGDRPEVLDDLVVAHADTVVAHGDRACVLVDLDLDLQLAVAFVQGIVGERLEAQLVSGVGGVGDQLAQKDLLGAVQRVDHQVQELLDLGLEAAGFLGRRFLGRRFWAGVSTAEASGAGVSWESVSVVIFVAAIERCEWV